MNNRGFCENHSDEKGLQKGEYAGEGEEKKRKKRKKLKGEQGAALENVQSLNDGHARSIGHETNIVLSNCRGKHLDDGFRENFGFADGKGKKKKMNENSKKKKGDEGAMYEAEELVHDDKCSLHHNGIGECNGNKRKKSESVKHDDGRAIEGGAEIPKPSKSKSKKAVEQDELSGKNKKNAKLKKEQVDQGSAHEAEEQVRNDTCSINNKEIREGNENKRKKSESIEHDDERVVEGGADISEPSIRKSKKVGDKIELADANEKKEKKNEKTKKGMGDQGAVHEPSKSKSKKVGDKIELAEANEKKKKEKMSKEMGDEGAVNEPSKSKSKKVGEKIELAEANGKKKKNEKMRKEMGDDGAVHEVKELAQVNVCSINHKENREGNENKRKRSEPIGHDDGREVDGGADISEPSVKRSKKVRFSGHVDVFPFTASTSDANENPGDGLVRGKRFSREEDELVKEAVNNYIKKHALGEEGLKMILNCRSEPRVRHCWKEIAAALPWRPVSGVYYRAHILFERGEERKWTPEECETVRNFHEQHGADWKALAAELGKHRFHVKDTWRRIRLQPHQKKGHWSQEEYQALFDLVNADLQVKACMEKKSKHGMLRDNISWGKICSELTTRSHAVCCNKWYSQLSSPMVAQGVWSDADDYRLVNELVSLDASCEDDVDWDNLLEHRSGDVCRKRWNQMVLHIGEHGMKSFSEQVEVLSQRYCPDLLQAREAYAAKTPVD